MSIASAKNSILEKLRAGRAQPSGNNAAVPNYQWKKIEAPLEQFQALLLANHACVIQTTETEIAQCIKNIIAEKQLHRVIASDRIRLQHPDLVALSEPLPIGDLDSWKEFLFNEVDAAITSSLCAIATTGTIVLRPGADEPRSLSLVPPCHIVIVRAETLHNDFAAVMQSQHWAANMPTNMLLVSGPSKTADIQQTLAYGAHGPRDLFVLLVTE